VRVVTGQFRSGQILHPAGALGPHLRHVLVSWLVLAHVGHAVYSGPPLLHETRFLGIRVVMLFYFGRLGRRKITLFVDLVHLTAASLPCKVRRLLTVPVH
jgi:hypothetical protein